MSITDELRRFANGSDWIGCTASVTARKMLDVADRIDAEYEKRMVDALLNDGLPMSDEVMAEHGWYRVLDADKQPIHIGDMMECDKLPNGNRVCGEVKAISNDCVWLINVQYKIHAKYLRHHREPTVEDVLREFAGTLASAENNWGSDVNDAIAKYAAKLQLRGDGE